MIRNLDESDIAGPAPRFEPGDLVQHRRYGYRGVVVAADRTCQAPSDWYMINQTQPAMDQPWYHLLVHGSAGTTYAAQENLQPDTQSGLTPRKRSVLVQTSPLRLLLTPGPEALFNESAPPYESSKRDPYDPSGEAIEHPLLPHFFGQLKDGRYDRSGEPWPGWQ